MTQKCNRLLAWLSGILLAGALPLIAQAGSANNTFNFAATFLGGSCEINVPASLSFNRGNIILPSEIFDVGESGTPLTRTEFTLSLFNCAGQGLRPQIRLSGNTELICGSTLYRNNVTGSGSARGYGVLIKTAGNEIFSINNNLGFNKNISTKSWTQDTRLERLNGLTLPIVAILRTGSCANDGRRGGQFRTNVTFEFIYE